MKKITLLIIFLTLYSCDFSLSGKKADKIDMDFTAVADSISVLMSTYHYNPAELATDQYLLLEEKVRVLANEVQTKQEFIKGFNELWKDGPFSHVTLGIAERSAEEMAEFVDTLRVGDNSVSLEWMEETAILTVRTMTGLNTKENVFRAYREIAENKTKALIIDVRNNDGGTFAGVPLIGHVLADSIDAGIFVSRKWWKNNTKAPNLADIQNLTPWQGWSLKSFWHDVQEKPLTRVKFGPMHPHFNGPVYILTSNNSASAAEFTVDALAYEENVTIIGETTAGEMLSQKMYDLPFDFQLSLPIAEYYSNRIGRIEGKGVEPDIAVDQRVAMDLAVSLINGARREDALAMVQLELDKMNEQPFGGERIYLLGNMNDWGKKQNITPQFEYKGNGIFAASSTLEAGSYEFKIAPLNWSFDYGAHPSEEKITIGEKKDLARVPGSNNLIVKIKNKAKINFELNVADEKAGTLYVTQN